MRYLRLTIRFKLGGVVQALTYSAVKMGGDDSYHCRECLRVDDAKIKEDSSIDNEKQVEEYVAWLLSKLAVGHEWAHVDLSRG